MLLRFFYSWCFAYSRDSLPDFYISYARESCFRLVNPIQQQDALTHNIPFGPPRLIYARHLRAVPLCLPATPRMGPKHRPQPRFCPHHQPQEHHNTHYPRHRPASQANRNPLRRRSFRLQLLQPPGSRQASKLLVPKLRSSRMQRPQALRPDPSFFGRREEMDGGADDPDAGLEPQ